MKIIGVRILLSKTFEKCSYWTLSRVLLPQEPNHAKMVNDGYAMTEDDKEFFFNEYFKTSCTDLSRITLALRKKLYVNHEIANNYNCFTLSIPDDRAIFYYSVSDTFPTDIFTPIAEKYIQYMVLRYWYWIKNRYDEVQMLDEELTKLEKQIKLLINQYCTDSKVRQRYNNGFALNPEPEAKQLVDYTPEIFGEPIEVKGLTLNSPSNLVIQNNTTYALAWAFTPLDSSDTLIFTLENGHVIAIDANGLITAIGVGTCEITISCANSPYSIVCNVTVIAQQATNNPPVIITQPSNKTGYVGNDVDISVVVYSESAATYQWYKDDVLIPLATNATLSKTNLQNSDAGNYHCVITNDYGVAISNKAILTIAQAGVFSLEFTNPFN